MFENPEVAFGGTKPMLDLIETIYAAVQQPELWANVMDDIAAAVSGGAITMFVRLPESQIFAMARIDEAVWASYAGYYASINGLIARCDTKFADGEVRYSHVAMTDAEFRRTEFCNDFFQPNDMYHSMGLKIPLKNLPAAFISCQRSEAMGRFNATEGIVYETLMPHLQRALGLEAQHTQMKANVLGLEAALDVHEHAVIGLDATARIVFCNTQAEKHLSADAGLAVKCGRLVCTSSAACNSRLQGMIVGEIGGAYGLDHHAGGPSTLLIERNVLKGPLQLTVFRFQAKLAGQSVRLAALVFLSSPLDKPRSRASTLRALYALTPTEARVADMLLQEMELRDVAERLRMQLETCRHHVKRVMAKTGTKKQAELVRLMLRLPAI